MTEDPWKDIITVITERNVNAYTNDDFKSFNCYVTNPYVRTHYYVFLLVSLLIRFILLSPT